MNVRLAAASTALLLGLTACGSDSDEPVGEAASEGSPSGGGASERPAYTQNPGEAGAEQFAGYWVDTLNEAVVTGDTVQLRSLGSDECTACTDFADQLDTIYGADGRVESEGWQVQKVVPEAGASDDNVSLLVTVDVAPETVFATADAEPKTSEGGQQAFRLVMMRTAGDWMIEDLTPR